MKNHEKHHLLPLFTMILIAVIWGTGFIATKMSLDGGASPALVMAVRFTVATVIIGVVFFRQLKAQLKREHLWGGFIVGAVSFAGFITQTVGLQYTTPSNNAFLTATNVIMVPFICWIFYKKPPKRSIFFCSFLCLAGIGFLSLDLSKGFTISLGDSLTLMCAFLFAMHIILTDKYAGTMPTINLVFLQFLAAAVLSLVYFMLFDRNFNGLYNMESMSAMLYLGLFSTCLCYIMQTWAQQFVEPSKASIVMSMESLFGTILSVMLGYEALRFNLVIGGGLVLLSLVLSELLTTNK